MTLEEAVGAQEAELELEAGRTLLNAGIQVGTLEGSENDVFGMIRDVAIGPKDEVFVLDDQQVRVKVYSGVGEFLTSFGRRGEGPGEFRIPVSISVGVDGSVFVLDPGNLRISVFHLADSEYELEREIPLTFPPKTSASQGTIGCSFSGIARSSPSMKSMRWVRSSIQWHPQSKQRISAIPAGTSE